MNLWLALVLSSSLCIGATAQADSERSNLAAPNQLSPADKTRLHGFPRRISFEWSKIHGADGYGIEIDYYYGRWASLGMSPPRSQIYWVTDTSMDYDFVGNQPGAWRVWAMDKNGRAGEVSAWSTFSFGPDNQEIPAPPPDTAPLFSRLPGRPHKALPLAKVYPLPLHDPDSGQTCAWPPPTPRQDGIIMPRAVYTPEPEFTEAARKAKAEGTVTLALNVGEDGLVTRVCIATASRDDLGLSAAKTVRTWRFKPAEKDGKPIAYDLSTEVQFHLY